jgi:hypothetical protein
MYTQVMMYTLSVQHLNIKYIVLWATQKKQNLTRFDDALFTYFRLRLCRIEVYMEIFDLFV